VDGGYTNNLPGGPSNHVFVLPANTSVPLADVMRDFGAQIIIAIDVSAETNQHTTSRYGEYLSGWWVLWNKWNPFAAALNVCNIIPAQHFGFIKSGRSQICRKY
jgi:lysophospholipid hydrolase